MGSKYRDSYHETFTQAAVAVAFSRVCGFLPKRVKVQNQASYSFMEWFDGMGSAAALVTTAASGIITKDSSTGITVGTVTDSVTGLTGKGFTIGLNTTVNIAEEKLTIMAE